MKKLFFLVLILFAQMAFGQVEYTLDSFDEISATGNIKVTLRPGDTEKAVIETYGVPEDDVNVYVKGQTLKISMINSLFRDNSEVKAVVYYKKLRSIRANAGAEVESTAVIEGDYLEAQATSGGILELEINVNKLESNATEGAIVWLKGKADSQKARATTGGQLEALEVECNNTYARAGTGGIVEVTALENLDAYANLGGEIHYSGDPQLKGNRKFLGGEVRRVN